jgi:hypothetical protein
VNPKTMLISARAWTIAGPAARTITAMLIEAPSRTSPVLMKNSVRNPAASRSRSPSWVSTTLPSSPSAIAYTGYSMTAATSPKAEPSVAAGIVCSRNRVAAPSTSTTATPASVHVAAAPWVRVRSSVPAITAPASRAGGR